MVVPLKVAVDPCSISAFMPSAVYCNSSTVPLMTALATTLPVKKKTHGRFKSCELTFLQEVKNVILESVVEIYKPTGTDADITPKHFVISETEVVQKVDGKRLLF